MAEATTSSPGTHGTFHGRMEPSKSSSNSGQPLTPQVGQFIDEFFLLAADIERSLVASGEGVLKNFQTPHVMPNHSTAKEYTLLGP